MKIIKGLAVLIVMLLMGSCFDPPEFPITPQIDYQSVEFKEGNATNRTDSLIVTISFKDGDGDLGIDAANPAFNDAPFNNLTFFQTNGTGKANLVPINTSQLSVEHINKQGQRVVQNLHMLEIENPAMGKLVFPRTKKQPGFGDLPDYSCEFYERFLSASYVISAEDKNVLDAVATVDTLYNRINGVLVPTHFVIRDTLYLQVNKNHYNIDVDFLVKEANGFVAYNWRKEPFCQQDLYGRFPILTDKVGPLEGEIRYAMTSVGFRRLFTIKTLKLRIKIRDQARNESNIVESEEFTL